VARPIVARRIVERRIVALRTVAGIILIAERSVQQQ
jgi:hypothetical protein